MVDSLSPSGVPHGVCILADISISLFLLLLWAPELTLSGMCIPSYIVFLVITLSHIPELYRCDLPLLRLLK